MEFEIQGEIAQTVTCQLQAGDSLWASKGAIVTHSSGIDWTLKIPGGLGGAVRRSLAGEGIVLPPSGQCTITSGLSSAPTHQATLRSGTSPRVPC